MLNVDFCLALCQLAQCNSQHFEGIAHREHDPFHSPNRGRAVVSFCLGVVQNLSHFKRSLFAKTDVMHSTIERTSWLRSLKVPQGT